ncbi:MAG: isocitrate lyase/phosphoenolpyruvate mutase family protein [Pseudomonadota bacterium]
MISHQDQNDRAAQFHALHHSPGAPLILYNVWDVASAKAVAKAGAPALASGSWSLAAAQGYPDGEQIPRGVVMQIAERIATSTSLPFSLDFEGGYADTPAELAQHTRDLLATGVIGINFEDRIVSGEGLYPLETQAERINAIRVAADEEGINLFINARTDLFFQDNADAHAGLLADGIARAKRYQEAGANGFFAPGLTASPLIKDLAAASPLPLNLMMAPGQPDIATLATLGVSRISFGPQPFLDAIAAIRTRASEIYR